MRTSNRLKYIPGFSIDQVADATRNDPDVLRLENLDTDLPPPMGVIEVTRQAIGQDEDNSYLPFIGQEELRDAVAQKISSQTNKSFTKDNVIITCGATEGMFDTLLAITDPGDEVILTDPTYAGMIYRVQLAGAIPRLVPFEIRDNSWRLDTEKLKLCISKRTKALFIMNPSMPSGAVLTMKEWSSIVELCKKYDLWLIYNAAMERILYDKRQVIHPVAFPEMEKRTITIGSASKELRMIGWRVGWVAGPKKVMSQVAKAHIYNVVTPIGIAQKAVRHGLSESPAVYQNTLGIWEKRRNVVNEQLSDYKMIGAAGGWSQILDVSSFNMNAKQASDLLLKKGKVAVTPMTNWGIQHSSQFIRIVFSNESEERLETLGERFFKTFMK